MQFIIKCTTLSPFLTPFLMRALASLICLVIKNAPGDFLSTPNGRLAFNQRGFGPIHPSVPGQHFRGL